jgi:hypothetical protein
MLPGRFLCRAILVARPKGSLIFVNELWFERVDYATSTVLAPAAIIAPTFSIAFSIFTLRKL